MDFTYETGVVDRVCVYTSLMTSGEFVRSYSLSVGQGFVRSIKGDLVCCIFWTIFSVKQNYCLFGL